MGYWRAVAALEFFCIAMPALAQDAYELKFQFAQRQKPFSHILKLTWVSPESNLQSISVIDPETEKVIQKISIPQDKVKLIWKDVQSTRSKETRESLLEPVDFNFDRYADLRLLRDFQTKTADKYYLIYIFDNEKKQYLLHEDLSALPTPLPKPKWKRIESTALGGFGGFESTTQHFSISPFGKLLLEARIESKMIDALRLTIRKEVFTPKDGQFKLTCRWIEEPERRPRQLMGTSEECQNYWTSPKPKVVE